MQQIYQGRHLSYCFSCRNHQACSERIVPQSNGSEGLSHRRKGLVSLRENGSVSYTLVKLSFMQAVDLVLTIWIGAEMLARPANLVFLPVLVSCGKLSVPELKKLSSGDFRAL